jgi:predicted MFS family arabinose efflux permease
LAVGQYWGGWVILVFDIQRFHDLTESRLGALYTMLSITAVVVMLLIAPRLQRLPLTVTTPLALVVLALGSFVIAYQPTNLVVLGFVLVGAGNGLIDVYLNVSAQRVEVATRRPVLQWLHASYALGGVTGAAAAGLLLAADLDFRWGLAFAGAALVLVAAWNARTAPRERSPEGVQTVFSISALFRTPALWVPALAVLFAFLVEGSMDTWSGLSLREQLGASAGVAAMAFIAFSGAVGSSTGDAVVDVSGRVAAVGSGRSNVGCAPSSVLRKVASPLGHSCRCLGEGVPGVGPPAPASVLSDP